MDDEWMWRQQAAGGDARDTAALLHLHDNRPDEVVNIVQLQGGS